MKTLIKWSQRCLQYVSIFSWLNHIDYFNLLHEVKEKLLSNTHLFLSSTRLLGEFMTLNGHKALRGKAAHLQICF